MFYIFILFYVVNAVQLFLKVYHYFYIACK